MEMQYPVKGMTQMKWGAFSATVTSPDEKAWHIVVKNDDKVIWDALKYVDAKQIPSLIEEAIRAQYPPYPWAVVDGRKASLATFFVFEQPAN